MVFLTDLNKIVMTGKESWKSLIKNFQICFQTSKIGYKKKKVEKVAYCCMFTCNLYFRQN